MGFGEAISVCLRKYVGFSGRARRSEYWWFILFGIIVSIVAGILDGVLGLKSATGTTANGPIGLLASLALLLPNLAVTVRRLHDTNRSGFWLLGIYGAIVVIAVFAFVTMFGAIAGGSGAGSIAGVSALLILGVLGLLIWLLVMMCLPGTAGSNRFGPDPKQANAAEEFK